jgi:hypothetical protein
MTQNITPTLNWRNIVYRQIDQGGEYIKDGDLLDFPITHLQELPFGPSLLRLYVAVPDEGSELVGPEGFRYSSGSGLIDTSYVFQGSADGYTYAKTIVFQGEKENDDTRVRLSLLFDKESNGDKATYSVQWKGKEPVVRTFKREIGELNL